MFEAGALLTGNIHTFMKPNGALSTMRGLSKTKQQRDISTGGYVYVGVFIITENYSFATGRLDKGSR